MCKFGNSNFVMSVDASQKSIGQYIGIIEFCSVNSFINHAKPDIRVTPYICSSESANSHVGRTDSEGCHYDSKKNKSHCHKKSKKQDFSSDSGENSYDRSSWRRWFDVVKDCQNTRAEILNDYPLVSVPFRQTKCSVAYGKLYDPL